MEMIDYTAKIEERLAGVQEKINAACAQVGRNPREIRMVVVSKSASLEAIKQVLDLGLFDLGENRVQRLQQVSAEIDELYRGQNRSTPEIRWHMIGHLQRNKVRHVVGKAHLIHSVDTLRLAEEINQAAGKAGVVCDILMQVNTSNEPQKYGVPVGAATHLAEQIETLPHLRLKGLMTMAPLTRNDDLIRACFSRAHELFVEMRGERIVGPQFTELSMGMSNDYDIAIQEGATILRIGSAIFAG